MKSPISHSKLARALFGATATALVVGASALVPATAAHAAPSGPTTVYDAIGSQTAGSYTSLGFQATSTRTLGDYVQLGSGPRSLDSVTVMMVNWACEQGNANDLSCLTTPGTSFSHPLTLRVYTAGGTDAAPTVGTLLAESTETFAIPFRPTAAGAGVCASPGQWKNPATGLCHFGFAHPVTFQNLDPVVLPQKLIWTISYNTQSYGTSPIGAPGHYNSLNVAVANPGGPFKGSDVSPDGRFLASSFTAGPNSPYCSGEPANPSFELRFDSCAGLAAQRPLASIVTTDVVVGDDLTVHQDELGVEVTTQPWNAIHATGIPSGAESIVKNIGPSLAAQSMGSSAPAALHNGHLKLATYGADQQARVTHFIQPNTVRLDEILDSQPSYWLYNDNTQSDNSPAGPSGGSLQIAFTCTNPDNLQPWYGTALISAGGDDPAYKDENGQLAQWNTWQQFKFPTADDPQGRVLISGNSNRPSALATGFTIEDVADLTAVCGDASVTAVRVNQGRVPRSRVVSYVDQVAFLGDTYDFALEVPVAPGVTTEVVFNDEIGGENVTTAVWNADHFEPKAPGVEAVVRNISPTNSAIANSLPVGMSNGNLKLVTAGTPVSQQARVVHHFDPSSAPTVRELLYSRPEYSVFHDPTQSTGAAGLAAGGNLQFGVQCGSWLASFLVSPGDSNQLDLAGELPSFGTWQRYQYPNPEDTTAMIYVATDGGTAPAGFSASYSQVRITDFIDRCGEFEVLEARANQGRNSVPKITSFMDDIKVYDRQYDFQQRTMTFAPVAETVLGTEIGGEDSNSQVWNADHLEPKLPGAEAVVVSAAPAAAGAPETSLTNGSIELVTLANQQARLVTNFAVGAEPTLREVLYSRPQYSVYNDSAQSTPGNTIVAGGNLQFGVQCGPWTGSVLLSPGDSAPAYRDIDGNVPAFDTWQTFRYPDPEDPASKVFIATDGGTPPPGFSSSFSEVSVTDLIDRCGDSPVFQARASQGRNSIAKVVAFLDNVQFLDHRYDFVAAVAPTITSGAPTAGQVGQAYSFQLTAAGTPAPSITVTGSLPPGITKNAAGLLSGTPTQAGHFEFEVRATNGANPDDVELVSIDVSVAPSITSGAPTAGQVGQAYSFQLTAAGTPAPSITVTGSLPPGITKNAAGLLSGTPTQAGHFEFEVRAANGANPDDVELLSIDVAAAPVGEPSLPDYVPVGPSRVFDTRPGQSPDAVRVVTKQQVGGSNVLEVEFTDLGDLVPASGVGAVSLNVTVDGPAAPGFVTVYPCGDRTLVSSVNFAAGQTVANAVITPLSGSGSICFYSSQSTDLVVDINGWFPAGRAFAAVGPTRVLDTRPGESPEALLDIPQSPIGNDKVLAAKVVGLAGTTPETGVGAVSLNVTVDEAAADGFLTVYPCGDDRPFVSNVNFLAGQTVANAVIAPVSDDGTVCFYSTADVDLVVDVNGWMKSASGFHPVSPERLLDTRAGQSPNALLSVDKTQVGGAHELRVDVVGLDGVVPSSGVSAVSLNVTTANPADAGFVTVYPCGAERPFVSSLNYTAGSVVPNAVIAPVSADGEVCFFSSQMSDLVVDINGWFAA